MAKKEFRSVLSDTKEFISESGSPYLDQYEFDFDDKKGEVIRSSLHKTDKPINVYEKIQADYDSCDINAIMRRFALGETSALDVKTGAYIDVTHMPKTFAELFDRINDCQALFEDLPTDVKEMFDNSYEEFWYSYGSDDFNKKIAEYNDRFVNHDFDEGLKEDIKEVVADE